VRQSSLTIHQALHGYRDGHRLLAASTSLDSAADRSLLQTLSDSPDASRIPLESPLLSGYPLPSGSFYVLAMTWPAPDVRRPGCVWTHSLLLDEHVLSLDDLGFLLDEFHRPSAEASWERYATDLQPNAGIRSDGELPDVAATVLWSLYDPPAPPVEMRAGSLAGRDPDRFLLAVLSQLWPELRHGFSFAVAPRTARRIDGRLLDLQITVAPQSSSWEQRPGDPQVRTVTKPLARRTPDWCETLIGDLASPGRVRCFLRASGPSVPPTRRSMWALASLWAALDPQVSRTGYEAIPAVLAAAFPDPRDAAPLKEALFGAGDREALPFPVNRAEMLASLAATQLGEGVPLAGLSLEQRGAELLADDEAGARSLISRISVGQVGEAGRLLLVGIGAAISDAQVQRWAVEEPELLASLASHSTDLASKPTLWRNGDVRVLWPKLRRPRAARARRSMMLSAMLQARATDFVNAAREDWSDGDELLLELLASGDVQLSDDVPLAEIPPPAVLAWLKRHGPSPRLAAMLLQVWKRKQLARVPVAEWNALLEEGGQLSDFTLALLFAAASDPESDLGPRRAVRTYEELFRRTKGGAALTKRATKVLSERTQSKTDSSARDMAASLIASAFRTGGWDSASLLDIDDLDALRRVLAHDPSGALAGGLIPTLGDDTPPGKGKVVYDALMKTEDHDVLHKALKLFRQYIPWG
jgi:hypothetical protein